MFESQGTGSIGWAAGYYNQANQSIAIGVNSGKEFLGQNCVAIGTNTGVTSQGDYSVAIGYMASSSSQGANSIAINATNVAINNPATNSCVIAPIRNLNGSSSTHLFYDNASGELTWGTETPFSLRYKENVQSITNDHITKVL